MRFGALCVAVCAGCFRPSPPNGVPCPDGTCPNGQSCVLGVCQPDGTGGNPDGTSPTPQLVPSNGISPTLLEGATADLAFDKLSIDTDDGSIRSANVVVRDAGEGLMNGINFVHQDGMGVFSAQSFTVPAGKSWDISGGNAIVLFAATTIDVSGTLDVGGNGQGGALGGHSGGTTNANPSCRGHAGGAYDLGFGDGGGGGGGVAQGGHGAAASAGTPVDGGGTCSTPSTRPLHGGQGGGAGGYDSTNSVLRGGTGGAAGGAIALVAMGSISVSGVVGSPGAGGLSNATGDGGGGGGSGGSVFLESLQIGVTGAITANGGGGGAASGGASGGRGHLGDANRAGGGAFNTAHGGLGGSANGPAGDGDVFTDTTSSRGCGGGGAAGMIEIRSITVMLDPMAVASPTPMMTTADVQ
jgi:hypothetical protein